MRVTDILPTLCGAIGKPFGQLFDARTFEDIIVAKGKSGKLLETILRLPPGCGLTDFEDGELKTNKAHPDGTPRETMFITQIATHVDELLEHIPFEQTWLYEKIRRIIYVPTVKTDTPASWYFKCYYDVHVVPGQPLHLALKQDYDSVCRQMVAHVEHGDRMLHTSSGHFIQIRTKDAKPYRPIYSAKYRRNISNKNFAFYFKKEFMLHVQCNYPALPPKA